MKVIGLTGGIGTGKSTVARFLAELGAAIIDADKVGHEVFQPGTPAWREIVESFGKKMLTPGGDIDRDKLAGIVFASPELLSRLNEIMHPRIKEAIEARLEEWRRQGIEVAVIEAPLLIEAKWVPSVDEVWVTTAPEDIVVKRIQGRSGMSTARIMARIRAQLPAEERLKHAGVVIETDCSLDELKAKVRELWQKQTE